MPDIDLTFIGEQMARVLSELREIRGEQAAMREELAAIKSGQNEIAVEVAVLGANVRDVKETLNIIEHDISAMKLRIERHTGLVKA
jgi:chromosome segregation ATPase